MKILSLFFNPEKNFRSWQVSRIEEAFRQNPPDAIDLQIIKQIAVAESKQKDGVFKVSLGQNPGISV
jgi:precorrin-3B methylase